MSELYSIEKALRRTVETIKIISHDKCFGIVTESFNDRDEEIVYSVYVVTPKLKDYNYRLMTITSKGYVSPFPVEMVLYARHPKNNKYESCKSQSTFEKQLSAWINSSITKLLIETLVNLSDLKDSYRIEDEVFNLSNGKSKQIDFEGSFQGINFYKCVLTNYLTDESNAWLEVVFRTKIIFECKFQNGSEISYPLHLISLVTPYTKHPVFDLEFYFPSKADLARFEGQRGKCTIKLECENENAIYQIMYKMEKKVIAD